MGDAEALPLHQPPGRRPLLGVLSDARLTKIACEGSSAAFAAIYRRHYQEIYRYCRSILRDEHEAADALQNTMLKAMNALPGEQRTIALKPWLYRIAHNEAVSVIRRRGGEMPLEYAVGAEAVASDPEARDRLRHLIADLERLTPRQRSALVMRELSGLDFEQIGDVLESSPQAAKQTVYEARLALHEFEAGREMTCDSIRRLVSDGDRRALRGRAVRAHLAGCSECERFERALGGRRRDLSALAVPLPAPAALAILGRILEGGGPGGIAALAGAGGASGIGAGLAVKLGVAGVLAVGAGTVALDLDRGGGRAASDPPAGEAGASQRQAVGDDRFAAPALGGASQLGGGSPADSRAAGADGRGHGARGGHKNHGNSPGASGAGHDQGSGAAAPVATGPAGTPPGQGATPPGQGGTPPGLNAAPPGHGGPSPGKAALAPAHGGTAPGQLTSPPGQVATAHGQSGLAHGNAATAGEQTTADDAK